MRGVTRAGERKAPPWELRAHALAREKDKAPHAHWDMRTDPVKNMAAAYTTESALIVKLLLTLMGTTRVWGGRIR
jgi:hypothetical protein